MIKVTGELVDQTELALCLLVEKEEGKAVEEWFPKSKITIKPTDPNASYRERMISVIEIPYWLAKDKKLI